MESEGGKVGRDWMVGFCLRWHSCRGVGERVGKDGGGRKKAEGRPLSRQQSFQENDSAPSVPRT